MEQSINSFIKKHPDAISVIGYGSRHFRQQDYNSNKSQIDMIYVVEDTFTWHEENFKINEQDYSLSKKCFFSRLKMFNCSDKLLYLPYLKVDNSEQLFKVGVVNYSSFVDDLKNFRTYQIAGRLAKPYKLYKSNVGIERIIDISRVKSLYLGLLISDDNCSLKDLLINICSLSFMGDVRMIFNMENKHKVLNIVNGEYQQLKDIYISINNKYCWFIYDEINDKVIINYDQIFSILPLMIDEVFDTSIENLSFIKKHLIKKTKFRNFVTSIELAFINSRFCSLESSVQYMKSKREKNLASKK